MASSSAASTSGTSSSGRSSPISSGRSSPISSSPLASTSSPSGNAISTPISSPSSVACAIQTPGAGGACLDTLPPACQSLSSPTLLGAVLSQADLLACGTVLGALGTVNTTACFTSGILASLTGANVLSCLEGRLLCSNCLPTLPAVCTNLFSNTGIIDAAVLSTCQTALGVVGTGVAAVCFAVSNLVPSLTGVNLASCLQQNANICSASSLISGCVSGSLSPTPSPSSACISLPSACRIAQVKIKRQIGLPPPLAAVVTPVAAVVTPVAAVVTPPVAAVNPPPVANPAGLLSIIPPVVNDIVPSLPVANLVSSILVDPLALVSNLPSIPVVGALPSIPVVGALPSLLGGIVSVLPIPSLPVVGALPSLLGGLVSGLPIPSLLLLPIPLLDIPNCVLALTPLVNATLLATVQSTCVSNVVGNVLNSNQTFITCLRNNLPLCL
jgi:hypothetical protein